jgi:ankyrin repeat protein
VQDRVGRDGEGGRTALAWAVWEVHEEMVDTLLAGGCDLIPHAPLAPPPRPPLYTACESARSLRGTTVDTGRRRGWRTQRARRR